MKSLAKFFLITFAFLVFHGTVAANQDTDNISRIVNQIKSDPGNGVRCLSPKIIRGSVESFYFALKSGAISQAMIDQSGGFYAAAVSSLRAQAIGAGVRCN